MLMLYRKVGERIMIGDDIVLEIVEIRGRDKVRIGVTAPIDVPVHRQEVAEAIARQGEATTRALRELEGESRDVRR
jgi:carbon storage regulator